MSQRGVLKCFPNDVSLISRIGKLWGKFDVTQEIKIKIAMWAL